MKRLAARAGLMALIVGLSVLPTSPAAVRSQSEPEIRADLEGRPIPAADAGRYHCEDIDFPRIHCYASAGELEQAVARRLVAPQPPGPQGVVASTATTYVRVFADKVFAGASAYLSTPYDDLSVIGWNDRISSFQGLGGAGGTFFQHIYGGGAAYPFNANQWVTYVGDTYNDTFSSVRPR